MRLALESLVLMICTARVNIKRLYASQSGHNLVMQITMAIPATAQILRLANGAKKVHP